MRRLILVIIALFITIPAAAETRIIREQPYGPDVLQRMDIYQPEMCEQRKCPVVIWVHGGGWRMGSKDMRNTAELMENWAGQGIVMVAINYRLTPKLQHPEHVRDVAAAVAWVYRHIADYGGSSGRIFLLGHSAGAHLVGLVGTSPTYLAAHGLDPSMLRGVFPIDTASFDLATNPSRHVQRMIRNAFGTDPAVLREASPLWNVASGRTYPPFIIAATANRPDAVETSNQLRDKLRSVGGQAKVIVVDYPGQRQLEAHSSIAKDLRDLTQPMTQELVSFVLAH